MTPQDFKSFFLHRYVALRTDKYKEEFAAKRYRPLFLLPSIALMGAFLISLGVKLDDEV